MTRRSAAPPRSLVVGLAALGAVLAAATAACSPHSGGSGGSGLTPAPAAATKIMDQKAYQAARWIWRVTDLDTGKALMSHRADEFAFTGSTAKQFTVGTVYDVMGADARLVTPVYAVGDTADGVLHGTLSLVASGDLTLGGRNAADDHADSSFSASAADHVYGDIAPNAVAPPGDPLAGLDNLAAQVAAAGITRIDGNVVIDDRLWQPFTGQEGPVPPIFVNDNLLDLTVTPGADGQPATVAATPSTSAFTVESTVTTEAGDQASLTVAADPADPTRLQLTGSIGVDAGPRLTVYRVPDAARWARTLFVEALTRAGVTVSTPDGAPDAAPAGAYDPTQKVASLQSPPLSAFGDLILKTSYNTGANALLCLLAVHEGSTECLDGLAPIRTAIEDAGLDPADVVLVDGQGADPASVTPAQMISWLRWTQTRPWASTFLAGQPVLGESGTLAANGGESPAKGLIAAKTGTSAHPDPGTGRVLFNVQALAGFMTTDDGRRLVFDLAMSGGTFADPISGIVQAGDDLADVAAAFQQALSK